MAKSPLLSFQCVCRFIWSDTELATNLSSRALGSTRITPGHPNSKVAGASNLLSSSGWLPEQRMLVAECGAHGQDFHAHAVLLLFCDLLPKSEKFGWCKTLSKMAKKILKISIQSMRQPNLHNLIKIQQSWGITRYIYIYWDFTRPTEISQDQLWSHKVYWNLTCDIRQ